MIGRLRGLLIEKRPPLLVIDVHGVGYEVEAPMTTFYRLPEINHEVTLHTHFVVREDAQLLFGFATDGERRLFRDLLKVNGVGPKVALAILSGIEADQFAICVQEGDVARLTRLPGIGKKTAERLIVEMRDRLGDWQQDSDISLRPSEKPTTAAPDPVADAVSALIALGYKPNEASRYVHAVAQDGMASEAIIREALRQVARAGS
jgi:Holliday junction DNA helicase RuvA